MARMAERGELLQSIVALLAEVGVGTMVHLQGVCRITRATAVAVACEGLRPESPPLCRTEIGLIVHALPALAVPHPAIPSLANPRHARPRLDWSWAEIGLDGYGPQHTRAMASPLHFSRVRA